jgi:hypothetical protein
MSDQVFSLRSHFVAVSVVVVAVCATGGFLGFARAASKPSVDSRLIDMSSRTHYTATQVSRAFASHGITLVRRSEAGGAAYYSSSSRLGAKDDGFVVTIFRPTLKVNFATSGPRARYDRLVGNVDVFYGGKSARFADRVAAAASTLDK